MEHDYERLIKVLTAAASLIGAFSMGSVPMSAHPQVLHTDTPAVWSLVTGYFGTIQVGQVTKCETRHKKSFRDKHNQLIHG